MTNKTSENRIAEYLEWLKPKLAAAKRSGAAPVALGSASLLLTSYGTADASVIQGSNVGFTPVTIINTGSNGYLNVSNPAGGLFFGAANVVPFINMNNAGGGFVYNLANALNPAKLVTDGAGTQVYGRLVRFDYGDVINNNMQKGFGYFNYIGFFASHPTQGQEGAFAPAPLNDSEIGFIAMIFDSGQPGWLKLEIFNPSGGDSGFSPNDFGYRILDWAYETDTAPGTTITIPNAVPEPSTLASLAVGAAGLMALHRRRKDRLAKAQAE